MTHPTRNLFGLLLGGALSLAFVGGPQIAAAEEPGPAAISRPAQDAHQREHTEYWRARAADARERLANAQLELDEANAAVSRMRRNNHPRGDARRVIREEQHRAQAAFEAASQYLEVELPAAAREAGAQQIWLRAPR